MNGRSVNEDIENDMFIEKLIRQGEQTHFIKKNYEQKYGSKTIV